MFFSSQLGITSGEVRWCIKLTVKSYTVWNIDKTITKVDQSNAKSIDLTVLTSLLEDKILVIVFLGRHGIMVVRKISHMQKPWI